MRAFWWFEDNRIAGMARPGFNLKHWFDLGFAEAVLLGWLGSLEFKEGSLASLHRHVEHYAPKIAEFYDTSRADCLRLAATLRTETGLLEALSELNRCTEILESYELSGGLQDGTLHFRYSRERLLLEQEFLKRQGVETVISLTEHSHADDEWLQNFRMHHIPIPDLSSPNIDQVELVAELIKQSQDKGIAVHCLAGIGRTTTMLMAAHILLGHSLSSLTDHVTTKNPLYKLVGAQAAFLQSIAG